MSTRLPSWLTDRLALPLVAAPMFLVSGPELVFAACRAGIVGAFPFPNGRTLADLRGWLELLGRELRDTDAPYAANMIVHPTYARLDDELALLREFKPKIVITALGGPIRVIEVVREYGGLVFADVNNVAFAHKAVAAGANGLVLVSSGAGGHTGELSAFAFLQAVREFYDGPIVLAGSIATGAAVRAVEVMGADLAYVGTPFIAAQESRAANAYKDMVVASTVADLIITDAFTGARASMLIPTIRAAGYDPKALPSGRKIDVGDPQAEYKAWKNIWSAGQGVGSVKAVEPAAAIVERIKREYQNAVEAPRPAWRAIREA
ncbi:MAG: nitronate monooxygenase [Xanthobacteraceae bacterium]|jgi:nitronate monooxygenase